MKNTWDFAKFTATDIFSRVEDGTFVVPTYQRGVVWTEKQKAEFFDTLKKGLPFGSILLYHDREKNQYRIIDGYQRSKTIYDIISDPSEFFSEDDIKKEVVKTLAKTTGVANHESLYDLIESDIVGWVHSTFSNLDDVRNLQFYDYAVHFIEMFPTAKGKEAEIISIVKNTFSDFKNLCIHLCDIEIPAIVIEGSEGTLPEIFERINNSGTKLSKYQVYAATWNKKYTINSDTYKNLIDYNKKRYEQMGEEGINLSEFDADEYVDAKELTLFEICYAYGKKLKDEYPHLFGKSSSINYVDSLGFSIFTSCLGLKNNASSSLQERLSTLVNDSDLILFISKIDEVVKSVDSYVGRFNQFKLNSRSCAGPLHTEFQIISLIGNVFINKYADVSFNDEDELVGFSLHLSRANRTWKKQKDLLGNNAFKHYCRDILSQRWKGTGDKKLDDIIFNKDYYSSDYKWDDYKLILDQCFMTIDNERKELKRVENPKEPEKLVLALVYLKGLTAEDQIDKSKYDIEHIATKKLMKNCLARYTDLRLPIGSIGNLCLLPQYDNRAKKEKTIYDDDKYLQKSKYSLNELETKFTFTKDNELNWLKDESLSASAFSSKYDEYIKSRETTIKKKIQEGYFPNK